MPDGYFEKFKFRNGLNLKNCTVKLEQHIHNQEMNVKKESYNCCFPNMLQKIFLSQMKRLLFIRFQDKTLAFEEGNCVGGKKAKQRLGGIQ